MVRSMFSGVSALKAHQMRLDVIGNNLANVLTVGYKGSITSFQDLYSQTVKGASSSTENRGGTNPSQIGLGATVATVTVNHTKGSVQRTEVPEHLMIDGNGFFVVSADANAQSKYYTVAGNFQVDELGFLVTTDGYKVLDKDMKPVQINKSDTKSATQTDRIIVKGNLNKDGGDYTTNVDVYDSLGSVHKIFVKFEGEAISTKDKVTPLDANDPLNGKKDEAGNPITSGRYSYKKMVLLDEDGKTPIQSGGAPLPEMWVKFNENGEVVDLVTGVTQDADGYVDAGGATHSTVLKMNIPGADDISLDINRGMFFQTKKTDAAGAVTYEDRVLTQVAKESEVKGVQLEGIAAGVLKAFEISLKGEVISKYTNGETKVTQTIALADFDNPAGLSRIGNNLFEVTPNSGVPKYGVAQTGSFGGILSGALEMSNVDMGAQFTDLILTQRGLQANTRVITTSDEVLQELVSMKR